MIRAVLFDLGGTLYDYRTLERANRESLLELFELAGLRAEPPVIFEAYREALRRVFNEYLPRPFYLHRDLFRDTLGETFSSLGTELKNEHYERYQDDLHRRQARDFRLRSGVLKTLADLRARGCALGIVSNIDEAQLRAHTQAAGLQDAFDWMLSSEAAGSCKPDSGIFQHALRLAGCQPGDALFVGDALRQDIAGANAAGLRSVLLWHREDREPPLQQAEPDHVIREIPDLLGLLDARN